MADITPTMGGDDWPPEVPTFLIASHDNASRWLRGHLRDGFRHVVSIGNPRPHYRVNVDLPEGLAEHPSRRIRIVFDDHPYPSGVEPTSADVHRIIWFLHGVDERGGLLIHCNGGVSRSGAVGYIHAAMHLGSGREREALKLAQTAAIPNGRPVHPNKLIVAYAADLLGRPALSDPID